MSEYYVYILASRSLTLYIGVTNDLGRRVFEHKSHMLKGFTDKYNIDRLVYFESTPDVSAAIQREKQLKGWKRDRKIDLISAFNPKWADLTESLFGSGDPSLRSG